jgi:hypothetical protein
MRISSEAAPPQRPPPSRSKAWACLLINGLVCPGLGSLLAGHWSGLPQLLVSVGGSVWAAVVVVKYYMAYIQVGVPQSEFPSQALIATGFVLASWLWSISTGISLLWQTSNLPKLAGLSLSPSGGSALPPAAPERQRGESDGRGVRGEGHGSGEGQGEGPQKLVITCEFPPGLSEAQAHDFLLAFLQEIRTRFPNLRHLDSRVIGAQYCLHTFLSHGSTDAALTASALRETWKGAA